MSDDRLVQVAERLAAILGSDCALIGGMAVSAWGHVRATEDVDFVARIEPAAIQDRLAKAGLETELATGDPLEDAIPWVIRGSLDDVPFEIIAPPVPVTWTDTTEVELPGGTSVLLIGLWDLIRLKIKAGGMHDLWDVAKLLLSYPEKRDAALVEAQREGLRDELQSWLDDPRL